MERRARRRATSTAWRESDASMNKEWPMSLDRPKVFRPFAVAGLLGLAALASPLRATAQDHTPDPYKPYNAGYDQFVYPTYPNGIGLVPNQNVLEGRSGYS